MVISIKAARVNKGLTLVEASKLLGVATNTLSRWENKQTSVPSDKLMAMTSIYDVRVENLRV